MEHIPEYEIYRKISYQKFVLNGKIFQLSNYPYLDIVFTDFCNCKCKFCIAHLVHQKKWCDIEAHKPKIKYAIEQLGVREVLLLGGEPTIDERIFHTIDYLKTFPQMVKICITTNGHRMAKDWEYAKRLISSGITHINLSLMSLDEEQQKFISGSKQYVGLKDVKEFYRLCNLYDVRLRINNNVFKGNNDTFKSLMDFYAEVFPYCHSVKFSPLLKTDSFSTVNVVTKFNKENILTDQEYDNLWHEVENYLQKRGTEIVRNLETFGFVEYSMALLMTPIIFNYNQHGQLRKKIVEEGKINNLKLLVNGELSLSWNREEKDYFIKC